MSKKRRSPQKSTVSQRRKRQASSGSSLVIPIIVGLVVVAVIVGAILSIENRPSSANVSVPVVTARPQATTAIPYPEVPRVSVSDTQKAMAEGRAIVVDVRDPRSYDQAHIAGAISIPEQEMSARAGELPRDKDVILYCT